MDSNTPAIATHPTVTRLRGDARAAREARSRGELEAHGRGELDCWRRLPTAQRKNIQKISSASDRRVFGECSDSDRTDSDGRLWCLVGRTRSKSH